jgi:hypothetical protein
MNDRQGRFAMWTAVALLTLPVLYVLSSGPMVTVAWRDQTTVAPDPTMPSRVLATTARS